MSANSTIEWTDRTWRVAARRAGVSVGEYRQRVEQGQKYCWRCRSWRARSDYGVDRSRWDGLSAICTPCRRPLKQLKLINETPAEYARRRYATDADFRARRRQHSHSRKRGIAPMPIQGIENLLDWTGGLCLYCPKPATTWDHIVPVSRGGQTVPGNMAPACTSCNSRKKAMDINDFIERYDIEITPRIEAFVSLAVVGGIL